MVSAINFVVPLKETSSDVDAVDAYVDSYYSRRWLRDMIPIGELLFKMDVPKRAEVVRRLISKCDDGRWVVSSGEVGYYFASETDGCRRIMPMLFRYDVLKGYCVKRGPSSELLRQIHGYDGWGGWSSRCFNRYGQDFLARFDQKDWFGVVMLLTVRSEGMSWDLIERALKSKRYEFVRMGLKEGLSVTRGSCKKILCWICAHVMNDIDRCEIISLIEERFPGIVAKSVDSFGGSLLWYTLFQSMHSQWDIARTVSMTDRFRCIREGATAALLIKCGCNPNSKHAIGLSWRDVCAV